MVAFFMGGHEGDGGDELLSAQLEMEVFTRLEVSEVLRSDSSRRKKAALRGEAPALRGR